VLPFAGLFGYVRTTRIANLELNDQFFADAAAGTLPQVAFVDGIMIGRPNVENDEHPPANVQVGEAFVASVVDALMKSPQWGRSVLFITYDEHGGFYDHVPPPLACAPDDILPDLQPGDEPGAFDRYGIRVPVVAVSPYARKHFVSHVVHDHTSILRFIETRFDLPALTRRDANADPMLEFFKFDRATFATPPKLPKAPIDEAHKTQCDAMALRPIDEL
jgi:phospholipase C